MAEAATILGAPPAVKLASLDLRRSAMAMGEQEARYLVDLYYQMQEYRKRSANQCLAIGDEEPHALITWSTETFETVEKSIKSALGSYAQAQRPGEWAMCAPPGSLVDLGDHTQKPIEELQDGQLVRTLNRRKAYMCSRPIRVASRPYDGDLIRVNTPDASTSTTPQHKWYARIRTEGRSADRFIVYLMSDGSRWRVGSCSLFNRRGNERHRLRLQTRCREERAHAWILKIFDSKSEASVYEEFIATTYGLTEWPFSGAHGRTQMNSAAVIKLFSMFDEQEQKARGAKCLLDHDLVQSSPLFQWTGTLNRQSPNHCVITVAANLIPGVMELPIPTKGGFDWVPLLSKERYAYSGPVYSLDVEEHHKYVQDGLITCNSIHGIGPVIAAGLLAHINVNPWKCLRPGKKGDERCGPDDRNPEHEGCNHNPVRTAGGVWAFAGLDPNAVWRKGGVRPWNARLKVLAWKIGDSFMKQRNMKIDGVTTPHTKDFYGKIYVIDKAKRVKKNEAGGFAELAARALTERKIKDKKLRATYESGRLPDGRIEQQAQRCAAKLFLSHYFEVAYECKFGERAPGPYSIEQQKRAHYIAPPNWSR